MRYALLLIALLIASGARGQTLAERVVGDWASADSIAYPAVTHEGSEVVGEDGASPFAIVYTHLTLTDSAYTAANVYWDRGTLQASETAWSYRIDEGQIRSDGQPPVNVSIRGDSLILARTDSLGQPGPYVYTRAASMRPPEALLGDWITEEMTDNAGVVFDLPFRFRADGTVLVGHGEPLAYRVLGPYLLMYETEFEDPASGSVTTIFRVSRLDLHDASARIQAPGGEPLVLYRR